MEVLNVISTFDKNLLELRFRCHYVLLKEEASDSEEEVGFSLYPVDRAYIKVELFSLFIAHDVPRAIRIVTDVLPRVSSKMVKTEVALNHLFLKSFQLLCIMHFALISSRLLVH